jgi:hypothetical protein
MMSPADDTHDGRSFDQWLAACSDWWDMTVGEEVEDHPGLEWLEWYEEGLTVEEAVERANARVFGG